MKQIETLRREFEEKSCIRFKTAPNQPTITVKFDDLDEIYLEATSSIFLRYSVGSADHIERILTIHDFYGNFDSTYNNYAQKVAEENIAAYRKLTEAFLQIREAREVYYSFHAMFYSGNELAEGLEDIQPVVVSITRFDGNGRAQLDIT